MTLGDFGKRPDRQRGAKRGAYGGRFLSGV